MMLSNEEAQSFVKDVLKVQDVSVRVKEDPLGLLNEIIPAFLKIIPFQSATLNTKPLGDRCRPSLQDIKEDVLSGKGGLCYTLNTFMKCLLEALGYKAHHCIGRVGPRTPPTLPTGVPQPDNHILTVVSIADEGGVVTEYMVDVGMGYPTFEAIPMDFKEESPIYNHSFMEYKFIRGDRSGRIVRCHRRGDNRPPGEGMDSVNGWKYICYIDLSPITLDDVNVCMDIVYTVPGSCPFHTALHIVQFKGLQALAVKNNTFLEENSDQVLTGKSLNTDELLCEIQNHFPLLYNDVTMALGNLGLN